MFKTILFSALVLGTLAAEGPAVPQMEQIHEIVVQNRILTKLNGKNISVLDVMKEMDVFLSRHYPQYMNSKTARFQFYSSQWRPTLQQMIDHELMVLDAETREVKVSDGEVREEIQTRFGPNVMETLDQLGISSDEARDMVYKDMIVQRIQWFRVTAKILQKVTSQEIKNAYQRFLQENPAKDEWKYQFLTIRAADEAAAQELAAKIETLKEKSLENLSVAADLFKTQLPPESTATLTVSQEFNLEDKAVSQAHRDVLSQMKPSQWSAPTSQLSRDGSTVVRIFHLKEHTKTNPPTFAAIYNDLKNSLLNESAEQEGKVYVANLHKRFGFDERSLDIPPRFEPFVAR
jgi:PPIC-type PPIASE domain